MSKAKDKGCSRCSRDPERGEVFRCYRGNYTFDVDLAREYISDGRKPVLMEADDVAYSIQRAEINEGHLEHVDPTLPGIVCHVFVPTTDGEIVRATRLIDGHHRAARNLRDGTDFYVYVLSQRESVKILIRSPKGARVTEYSDEV
jgi:hypothetical protein